MTEGEIGVEIQMAPAFEGMVSVERLERVVEAVLRSEGQVGSVTVVVTVLFGRLGSCSRAGFNCGGGGARSSTTSSSLQ